MNTLPLPPSSRQIQHEIQHIESCLRLGLLGEARGALESLPIMFRADGRCLLLLLETLQRAGSWQDVRQLVDSLATVMPFNAKVWQARAKAQEQAGQPDQAKISFRRACDLDISLRRAADLDAGFLAA